MAVENVVGRVANLAFTNHIRHRAVGTKIVRLEEAQAIGLVDTLTGFDLVIHIAELGLLTQTVHGLDGRITALMTACMDLLSRLNPAAAMMDRQATITSTHTATRNRTLMIAFMRKKAALRLAVS